MKRIFIETREFSRKWKLLGMTDNDLNNLQMYPLEHPDAGKIMQGTGGVRKLRWARSMGKSSGIRALYIDFTDIECIYLITAFGKNEKDNISAAERNIIKEFIKSI